MIGNVFQWCEDRDEMTGPDRVVRGGGWPDGGGRFCRAADRYRNLPSFCSYGLGFRLARVRAEG